MKIHAAPSRAKADRVPAKQEELSTQPNEQADYRVISARYETIGQLATRIVVAPRTIQKWCQDKRIPFIRLGRLTRFDPVAVDAAIRAFTVRAVGTKGSL